MMSATPTREDTNLCPCNYCGRNFRPDVLSRHMPICAKSQTKKRKVFDSGKMRAKGSDIPVSKTLRPGEVPKETQKDKMAAAKTANWRQHHEEFIRNLRAAKQYTIAKESGGPLPPPPPPVINPDFIQCPYCSRRFNEKAAERHIPFCKEKSSRVPVGGARLNASPAKAAPPRMAAGPALSRTQQPPSAGAGYGARKPSGGTGGRGAGTMGAAGRGDTMDSYGGGGSYGGGSLGVSRGTLNNSNARQSEMARVNMQRKTTPTNNSASGPTRGAAPASRSMAPAGRPAPAASRGAAPAGGAGFCHECGNKFPSNAAKFCAECGTKKAF